MVRIMVDVSDELNDWKEKYKESEKNQREMIYAVVRHCDKDMLIDILKKRKIIKKDYVSGEVSPIDNQVKGFPTLKEIEE